MRARFTLALIAVLALGGGVAALGLGTSTGIDTLVGRGSPDYVATQAAAGRFGGDAIVVLIREPLTRLIEPAAIERVLSLETCLAGESPRAGGACVPLTSMHPAQVVYGPGTFLNHAVTAVSQEIEALTAGAAAVVKRAEATARRLALAAGLSAQQATAAATAAGRLALEQQLGRLSAIARRASLAGTPSLSDTAFLTQIVFGASSGSSAQPNPRFAYVFPSADAAVIQVRLRPGLSDGQRSRAIALVREAVSEPRFALGDGGSYLVAGEPVLLNDLATELAGQLVRLLIGAVVVMGLVLLVVFRRRPRLAPLAVALAALGITFGLVALVGGTLTMASIAVVPILIGLVVDYGIQVQSGTPRRSIAVAALATAVGFVVLQLSPVPMVRGFGAVLVVGVAVGLAVAFIAVPAVLTLTARAERLRVEKPSTVGGISTRKPVAALGASVRGAREILGDGVGLVRGRLPSLERTLAALTRRPGRVLAVGLVLAAAGWALDTQIGVQSDLTKLVPAQLPALRDLRALEATTGVSGEVDVLVSGDDVATPSAIAWMESYERRVLAHFGFDEATGCARATLCPALSLPDLFSAAGGRLTQTSIDALLSSVPRYFSEGVITADRRYASLAFGLRLMPIAQQRRVIDYLRAQLAAPGAAGAPASAGLHAAVTGDPVLAADADSALSSSTRRLLTVLAGLVAVALALLAALRDVRRALVPLIPIVLATGWSALILSLIGVPLNPMSATLGALVIAISTEFSVLLSERAHGGSIVSAYRSTGVAVFASGVTAIAGFGVLVVSDIPMLRDFGWVTVIDMTVALVGVLAVLPAVIALADLPSSR